MSWCIDKSGTTEEVVKALEGHLSGYPEGDQSKEEYEAAKPHLIALVKQNVGDGQIFLSASGHGNKNADGTWQHKNCQVIIRRTY